MYVTVGIHIFLLSEREININLESSWDLDQRPSQTLLPLSNLEPWQRNRRQAKYVSNNA